MICKLTCMFDTRGQWVAFGGAIWMAIEEQV